MELKNDCERDYIKEAFDKLYNCVMPYIDLTQFAAAGEAFKELDKKVHSEIYILKKCLAESDRAVEAGLTRSKVLQERISDLEQRLNHECKHGEDLADVNSQLASENADLKERTSRLIFLENSRTAWRSRAQHAEKAVTDLNKKVNDLETENANLRETSFDTIDGKEKEINDLKKKIQYLETENANLRVTPPDANAIEVLKKENSTLNYVNKDLAATCEARLKLLSEAREEVEQYKKSFMVHHEENNRLREVIDGRDNEIHELEKKIQDLEEENASLTEDVDALVAENTDLHTKLSDDAIRIKSLDRANSVLRSNNEILWSKMEECDLDIFKRPWHGDGNAMTGERTSYKSLVEAIEFQNKKIEELEAEKARLKEAYDVHETTIKKLKENVDLSPGHELEFGDKVFVPWSDAPYMYVKTGLLYNTRTKTLVYVGKDQHLKWFGEKFAIV